VASDKSGWSERELIFNIAEIFAATNSAVIVGIGDDAAILARPENHIVVTTDMAVEDVHFKVNWSSAEEIGRKVAAANLADIYAMGGRPKYLTVAMSATGNEELEWMLGIARGIAHEAKIAGAQVVGGDLARGEKIVISITAIGECTKEILRSGAKVGDSIYITTLPGWSAAGLLALQKNIRGGAVDFAISEHRAPSVDYDNAEQIAVGANSLCDISDSLMIQAEQMASASGVEFEIDGELIKAHPEFAELSQVAELLDVSIFDLILSGGEDHVFLATGHALKGFEIGKVRAGSGIRLTHLATPQPGWQHFS
jgi:thiamine-monophosphate kinase